MKRAEFERMEAKQKCWKVVFMVLVVVLCSLAGLSIFFPLPMMSRKQAYRAEARNEVVNLVRAVKAYEMEYSKLPLPAGTTADFKTDTDEAFMADFLRGDGGGLSPQFTRFYAGKAAREGRAGLLVVDPKLGPRLVDPWGRPYVVIVDGNGDGKVTGPDGAVIEDAVISCSLGEDGVFDAKDPKSW